MCLWLTTGGLHSDEVGCSIAKLLQHSNRATVLLLKGLITLGHQSVWFPFRDHRMVAFYNHCTTVVFRLPFTASWEFLYGTSWFLDHLCSSFLTDSLISMEHILQQLPLKGYVRLRSIPACLKKSLFYPYPHYSLARYRILGWNHFPDNFWSHLPTVF